MILFLGMTDDRVVRTNCISYGCRLLRCETRGQSHLSKLGQSLLLVATTYLSSLPKFSSKNS